MTINAHFVMPPELKRRRWCAGCSKSHPGSLRKEGSRRCHDCGVGARKFHIPPEGKLQWCKECAPKHPGAVFHRNRPCEDCAIKLRSHGFHSDGLVRWCGGCAKKSHPGAVTITSGNPRCEDCTLKFATFTDGSKTDAVRGRKDSARLKKRWCAPCSKAHPNSFCTETKIKCEDCKVRGPATRSKRRQHTYGGLGRGVYSLGASRSSSRPTVC